MNKVYVPRGVCSRRFDIDIENGIINDITVTGGCSGNLQGISALLRGQRAEDVIARLKGIRCGAKSTSCPDQIACALEAILAEDGGNI